MIPLGLWGVTSMDLDYWLHMAGYLAFVGVPVMWVLDTLQKRAQARRRRLTTVTARLGLFVSWIATAVAFVIGGVGVVGFNEDHHTPINQDTWVFSGGLCAGAFVVCLLGRG